MDERYLYKAKRLDNREWVEGYLFFSWERAYILWGTINGVPDMIEVDHETICMCTGLRDKNNKLIWENDIVRGIAYSSVFTGYIVWIDEIAGFGVRYFNKHREPTAWENSSILKNIQSGRKDEFAAEVNGNIFDTPELLEVEE